MAQESTLMSLRGLRKSYDTQEALNGLDLDVYRGEFLTLLGPSGCGKTTTLRIIAGLESPTSGEVYLEGENITALPPEKREVNTVFQNYALFPHMTVEKNIGYGLQMRRMAKREIGERVSEMLALVQLQGYGKRLPSQLSGGQRQRVAIARAAILKPKLLLLDEPLGALDLKLRRQMQVELKKMQQQLGITFIYITHDQEEAMNMSDRIALMRDGLFEQLDTPQGLYEHPKSAFAAQFIGETNLLCGVASAVSGNEEVLLDIGGVSVPCRSGDWIAPGERLCLCVRAERLHHGRRPPPGMVSVPARLAESRYAGGERTSTFTLSSGQTMIAHQTTEDEALYPVGSDLFVWWNPATAALVPPQSGPAL
ncbi:MAG: ABC transporter ATP-binding protein [Christensenellales bacterium]